MSNFNNIPELFGSMVFNDEQMRQRLPGVYLLCELH